MQFITSSGLSAYLTETVPQEQVADKFNADKI